MSKYIYILFFVFFTSLQAVFSQENKEESSFQKEFSVKVAVLNKTTNISIKNAEVTINGIMYNYLYTRGKYLVKAKKGDQLVVAHPDFETVFYTIQSNEDIKILVEGFEPKRRVKYTTISKSVKKTDNYHQLLDSAKWYTKKDIGKSLVFIEKTLKSNQTKKRTANSYKVLATIYTYWKQYDLAIDNYKTSLQFVNSPSVLVQLAQAQFLQKKYLASKKSYKKALTLTLSTYQQILAYEGLGDVFLVLKKNKSAKQNYQKALELAKTNTVIPKITDLNSKIATVFDAEGDVEQADAYYQNTLQLVSKENSKRVLNQQDKVANYYNKNRRFDDEIKLRKKSLLEAEKKNKTLKKKKIPTNVTSQKINYKIGNAYLLKEKYNKAIPFLKKSIVDAEINEDLVVKKDATRKLSEVYATVGEYTKALKSYQDYVKLVDKSYIKKAQEIQQAKQFLKKISDNQNRIASLEKDKELTESKINLAYIDQLLTAESNKRQQWVIYSLLAVVLLVSFLAFTMFKNNKQQKLANNLLALKSMRSQMNPHFIFNALNSVNSFIAVNDERSANRYLSEFSALMRSVLENSDEDFIPLAKEIDLLELYVKLEHNRFKDKFEYTISVDKNIQVSDFKIPPMLLQPYIENAIWHGLRYKKVKGNLEISIAKKDTETIAIEIKDDGVGRKKSGELKTKNQLKQKSKGMSTIKNRVAILNDMYKDRITVTVSDVFADGRGTKVELLLKKVQ